MSVSPRSTALSRAGQKRYGNDMSDFTRRLESNIDVVLQGAALLVAVVIACIVGERFDSVTIQQNWPEVTRNGCLAGVVLLAVLCVTAWVTGWAYMKADHTVRLVLLGLFLAVAVLLTVAFWMYFREDRMYVAFWLVVAALVGVAVHAYLCYREVMMYGALAMVPLALLCLFLIWQFWPESSSLSTSTTTTA